MIGRMPRLDVVGIIVSDIARAMSFYRRLGLEFAADRDPEGHGHVKAPLPGGLRFTLDTEESIRSFDPDWSPPSGGHRMAAAFLCESPQAGRRPSASTRFRVLGSGTRSATPAWQRGDERHRRCRHLFGRRP